MPTIVCADDEGVVGSDGDAHTVLPKVEPAAQTSMPPYYAYSTGPAGDEGSAPTMLAAARPYAATTAVTSGVWLQPMAAEPWQQRVELLPGVHNPCAPQQYVAVQPHHQQSAVAFYSQEYVNTQYVYGVGWAPSDVVAVPSPSSQQEVYWHYNPGPEVYSRKLFVGGLPVDVTERQLYNTFGQFGQLNVDWPHKTSSKDRPPPKGYVFLVFEQEASVQRLVHNCHMENDKLYMAMTSRSAGQKAVQIRPWRLADADFVTDASLTLDPRKTVFIGGVPRPLKAVEVAQMMDELYGSVCYAGIDTDPELKYPKGAGRVSFSSQQSYLAAISDRFVQLTHAEVDKRVSEVEVKPYVLDEQHCDECSGARCGMRAATCFCPNVTCLQYYCDLCWSVMHSRHGREYHQPLVKDSSEHSPRSRRNARLARS